MNIPVICPCGSHLRLACDTDAKKLVAICSECESVYDITVELSDESVAQIKARFVVSEMGKNLSYMVKRV